ncbi:hypothetical protein [Dactylosporangium sp. CA-092794]|uniref:hypothetical protein n=1 Tax=Dactylosporangium sp. CA-092794 TaxID=3239929 RepID=UPI003D9500F1
MPSIPRIRVKLLAAAGSCLLAIVLGAAPATVLALAFATAAIPAAVAVLGGVPLLRALSGLSPGTGAPDPQTAVVREEYR